MKKSVSNALTALAIAGSVSTLTLMATDAAAGGGGHVGDGHAAGAHSASPGARGGAVVSRGHANGVQEPISPTCRTAPRHGSA